MQFKNKKRQVKKPLPKNVFEIVGEKGEILERVDSNPIEKKITKSKENQDKPTFSERTTKRRVNHPFYLLHLHLSSFRDVNGML
jgi:hypothetical protein